MSVLGMVEFSGIAVGIRGSDAMVKAARVELLESRPITPGKYITLITGDVASVESSVAAGIATAGQVNIVESFTLANLHEQVLPAILGKITTPKIDALGILETKCAASIVESADAACKAAPVSLILVHLANHIGGKGYATITGNLADVEAAVDAGAAVADQHLIERVVIPNPYPELNEYLTRKHSW